MSGRDWDSLRDRTTIPWADFSFDEFVQFYWKVVAPILEEEGYNPDTPTPASVLRENGFGRYIQAIRRHYDYSCKGFLTDKVGVVEPECPHEYNWPIDDSETKRWLDNFVIDLRKRDSTKEKESTIQRIAMNNYSFLQEWKNAHGSTDIIQTLAEANEDEAYQLTLAVYDRLNERVPSENTKCRYVTDHGMFFDYLTQPGNPLDYNPIPEVADRFKWSRDEIDAFERSSLSADQVKRLWQHANTLEEKMVIVAACAWGLRNKEIGALHVSQLRLQPDEEDDYDQPVVSFEKRKNGPSTVNIIFGKGIVEERIKELKKEYGDSWNGYIFPSGDRRTEHLKNKGTREHRFAPVAQRAEVTVDGDSPTLREARRFWYQLYLEGVHEYHDLVTAIAEEQGSTDSNVVVENYLGEKDQVRFARTWMHNQLDDAFGGTKMQKEPIGDDRSLVDIVQNLLTEFPSLLDGIMADAEDQRSSSGS